MNMSWLRWFISNTTSRENSRLKRFYLIANRSDSNLNLWGLVDPSSWCIPKNDTIQTNPSREKEKEGKFGFGSTPSPKGKENYLTLSVSYQPRRPPPSSLSIYFTISIHRFVFTRLRSTISDIRGTVYGIRDRDYISLCIRICGWYPLYFARSISRCRLQCRIAHRADVLECLVESGPDD